MMTKKTFPIEEIAFYPAPGQTAPGAFAFSPDDALLTYLYSPEHSLERQLFALDLRSGQSQAFLAGGGGTTEENISLAEALRRERQRQMSTGVTAYEWAHAGKRVLVPFPDGLYVQDGLNAPLRKILEAGDQPVLDARFSPDGRWVSYVQDGEVSIVPAKGGEPLRLTHGARGTGKTHGLAEFVAQEEMDRSQGYWWSEDSRWLAFEEVDETHIPVYRIVHQGKAMTGESAQEDHHYPFAGQANAEVRLGVVPVQGGEPVWMELEDFEYLARVQWLPDGHLSAQLQNRAQTELKLVCFDITTGQGKTLLSETSPIWVNLHDMFYPLPARHPHYPNGFIWASERSGFQHLYLYDGTGSLVRALTEGEWMVESIAGVDAKREKVYFSGWMDSPLESQLYEVSLEGGTPRQITREAGMHKVHLDHALKRFVDLHDSLNQPPHASLCRLSDGKHIREIYRNDDPRLSKFKLSPPELVSFQNRANITLHGAIYRPSRRTPKPLPTIVFVYGCPHVQMVQNSWQMSAAMRVQFLRSLGYVVFVLDNRGSARRGLAFEGAIRWNFGDLEVQDQVDGVRWLVDQGISDPARVAIYGWSGGGYMSAMCLCRAPETFQVAVAGAPVTHFDGYDSHYTERYMGTPQTNPEGYEVSSVLHHVENLRGKLMLVHGLIDENVHFRHSARLINALIRAHKSYSLLLFPDERHSPRRLVDRVYMEERIRDFLVDSLK
jgi:dipeptidyl-peptidase 4